MVNVVMPQPLDRNYKSWAKRLDDIDDTQPGGFAFVGDFLHLSKKSRKEIELTVGQLILAYMGKEPSLPGSDHAPVVTLLKVLQDGTLETLYTCECDSNKGWSREVFKEIKNIFIQEKAFRPRQSVRNLVDYTLKAREIMDNFDLSNLEDIPFKNRDDLKNALNEILGLAEIVKKKWEDDNNEVKSSGVSKDVEEPAYPLPTVDDPGDVPF